MGFTVIDGGLACDSRIKDCQQGERKLTTVKKSAKKDRQLEKERQTALQVAKELLYKPEILDGIKNAKTSQEIQSWLVAGRTW